MQKVTKRPPHGQKHTGGPCVPGGTQKTWAKRHPKKNSVYTQTEAKKNPSIGETSLRVTQIEYGKHKLYNNFTRTNAVLTFYIYSIYIMFRKINVRKRVIKTFF